jgi:hypothetical protein
LWSPRWLLMHNVRSFHDAASFLLDTMLDKELHLNLLYEERHRKFNRQEVTVAIRFWIASCDSYNISNRDDITGTIFTHILLRSEVKSPLCVLPMVGPVYMELAELLEEWWPNTIHAILNLIIDIFILDYDGQVRSSSTNIVNEAFVTLMDIMSIDFGNGLGTTGFVYLSWLSALPNSEQLAMLALSRFGIRWFDSTPEEMKELNCQWYLFIQLSISLNASTRSLRTI